MKVTICRQAELTTKAYTDIADVIEKPSKSISGFYHQLCDLAHKHFGKSVLVYQLAEESRIYQVFHKNTPDFLGYMVVADH